LADHTNDGPNGAVLKSHKKGSRRGVKNPKSSYRLSGKAWKSNWHGGTKNEIKVKNFGGNVRIVAPTEEAQQKKKEGRKRSPQKRGRNYSRNLFHVDDSVRRRDRKIPGRLVQKGRNKKGILGNQKGSNEKPEVIKKSAGSKALQKRGFRGGCPGPSEGATAGSQR